MISTKVTIDRILCAVDLSAGSRTVLTHALALSRWYQAKLTVLYVFRQTSAVENAAAGLGLGVGAGVELDTVAREHAEGQLRALLTSVPGTDGAEVMIDEGVSVRDAILQQAEALTADLLVLGSHGFTGVNRLLLGSTAESVLHHAAVPVLIVPPHAAPVAEAGVPFKRIVCAVDFEADSYPAFHYALNFAQESDGQLTLLHVLQVPPARRVQGVDRSGDDEAARQSLARTAHERLEALVPEAARAYCSVQAVVHEGQPSAEILRVAQASQADLIIMGVRGRDAIDVALFGSQTRGVVHAAQCPVFTVRQD